MKLEDFHTPTWKRLAKTIEDRIDELRELNDQVSLSVEQTAAIRGSIAELKKILALAEQASAGQAVLPGELTGEDDPPGYGQQ